VNKQQKREKLFKDGYSSLYIIGEMDDGSGIQIDSSWLKIGQASVTKGVNPMHQRLRALSQGNFRQLEAKYVREGYTEFVNAVEKDIHIHLKQLGIECRHTFSKQTGHGEWFKISLTDAIQICKDRWDHVDQVQPSKKLNARKAFTTVEGILT